MTLIEAARAALEALEAFTDPEGNPPENTGEWRDAMRAIEPLRTALAAAQVPLTDEQMTAAVLADRTLRHHFALNGGAGPVSEKGIKVFRAVEIAIRGTT